MPTSRDVASLAGVSVATVSRVFNTPEIVLPATRQRVERAAESLAYIPNQMARALKTDTLSAWALLLSDIENPFSTTVARGVEEVAREAGYGLMLFNSAGSVRQERELLPTVHRSRCAGVLVTPVSATSDLGLLLDAGVPVVAIDRPLADSRADSALVNSRQAARQAVAHLAGQGATRIACVSGPKNVFTATERAEGWREGLRAADRDVDARLLRHASYRQKGGFEAMQDLLAQEDDIDGVLFANSLLALGGLEAIRAHGVSAVSEPLVVAFDDAPWTRMVAPHMALIRQPALELGRTAGEMMLSRLAGRSSRASIVLSALLEPATSPSPSRSRR